MLYRPLRDLSVSILGFGAMRLPLIGGTHNPTDSFSPDRTIDEDETARMVEYAMDQGINYFDTAYNYHGGKSEVVMGRMLKPHRDSVIIATKLPVFLANKREDFDRFLNQQLRRLQTSYVDLYLVHGLNEKTWESSKALGLFSFLEGAQKDGRIRRAAFSFHDTLDTFKDIVDAYDWAMCQIQYNYLDQQFQAGTEGLAYAASKGIAVVAMEPLRGGKLAKVPPEVEPLFEKSAEKHTPAEWALRWVWNHPEISTVLSGMGSLEQVRQNIASSQKGEANSLSADNLAFIEGVRKAYRGLLQVDCSGCAYCMPCPSGVNIPHNFSLYNDLVTFKDPTGIMVYNSFTPPEQRASACSECSGCEDKCPQQIPIREELKKVHAALYQEPTEGRSAH
jgi:uncharacterized protein